MTFVLCPKARNKPWERSGNFSCRVVSRSMKHTLVGSSAEGEDGLIRHGVTLCVCRRTTSAGCTHRGTKECVGLELCPGIPGCFLCPSKRFSNFIYHSLSLANESFFLQKQSPILYALSPSVLSSLSWADL